MFWRWLLLYVLFLAGNSLASWAAPPNIVLITLDTTRADRMGFLGSPRGLTPNLDALARQGVVFSRAYAHVPLTTASHASILTGTYPQFNHVNDFGAPLAADLPYLPDILRQKGYHTGAFVGSIILDAGDAMVPGFDRGFEIYDAGFHKRRPGEDRYQSLERRAGEVVAHALAWLNKQPRGPFFLWLHLYDAHDPYDPPEPFQARYAAAPYDGEIAYTDSAVGRFLGALRARGLYEGALIAVMADHGEAFGEHGERTHGVFLYDETIHVPLLLKLPGERFAGQRVESRVGLVDVAPTVLQVANIQIPAAVQGQSLLTLVELAARGARAGNQEAETDPVPDRAVYAEADYPQRAFGWSALRALRTGKYLYIQAPERELYDQAGDPAAAHNLAAQAAAVTDTLAAQVEEFRRKTSSRAPAAQAKMDPERMEKLSALGYVASEAGPPDPRGKYTGADPKGKIEIANQLHDALLDMEEARYQAAIPRLERVLAEEPKTAIAYLQLGTAWTFLKNHEKALPALRKAVDLIPESSMAHYELGLALFETGDLGAAAAQFEAAVAGSPRWAELRISLAAVYVRIERAPEAVKELQTALELNPDHFRANLLLGRMLALQGQAAAGLPNLRKAAKLQPNSPEAHLFLAGAYAQLGQAANARRERAEAERLQAAGRR